jgi:hypothetical protein
MLAANGHRDASSQTQNVNGVSGGAVAAGSFANGLSRSVSGGPTLTKDALSDTGEVTS